MIDDMTVRNLSPATQRSYLHAVAKFSRLAKAVAHRAKKRSLGSAKAHYQSGGWWAGHAVNLIPARGFHIP
jgi:hypothetical protein